MTRIGAGRNAAGDVRAIPFPEKLRPLVPGASEAELAEAYLDRLRGAIRSLEDDGVGFAGLIVCSIFANEGLPDVPRGFMPRAAEIVRAAGGLVIADEVQAGYCRTGRWWGYDVTGFTPDIVVTGKPMGNGLPLAATAASRALVEGFRAATRYFNTFASSPLQAAVGMAVLDVIERDGLRENVAAVGAFLKAALGERKATLRLDRRRARPRAVHRRRDRQDRRRPDARYGPGDRGHQSAQGQGIPDQQCRRLPERREDPAAAGLRAAATPRNSSSPSTRRWPRSMDKEADRPDTSRRRHAPP